MENGIKNARPRGTDSAKVIQAVETKALAALLLFAAAFCGDNPLTALVLLTAGAAVQIISGRNDSGRRRKGEANNESYQQRSRVGRGQQGFPDRL